MSNNFEETIRNIGLFGGAFDPVHRAHIKMAKMAADQLRLDSVRWIPAGNPAHKEIDTRSEASFKNVTNCSKKFKR